MRSIERDNGSGDIWEWWDVDADGIHYTILDELSRASAATIRYEGKQYYKDRTISSAERSAIKRTLSAYQFLKNRASQLR